MTHEVALSTKDAGQLFVHAQYRIMAKKWNNDIMTKPARPPLDLGEALTRNRITTWSGLSLGQSRALIEVK